MENTVIMGEAIAGRQLTVRRTLIKLTEDLNKHTFDAAELLYEVQENKYYHQWGFQSAGEYAATELGLKERKSQYLSRVVKICKECGIKRTDYEPAGISKLRLITSLNPDAAYFNKETRSNENMAEHIVALIAEAPELSTKEVEERVDHLKGMDGDNAMITRSYRVTKSAYEHTVQRCFESVRKRLGSKGRDGTGAAVEYTDGNCLEAVCAEYNADPRNFYEELDESREQIEVQEEYNVSSTGSLSTPGTSGTPVHVDITEEPQDPLPRPSVPFIVPTED
jgi:hypothetical protein